MAAYRLTIPALRDVAAIITYRFRHNSPSAADQIESKLLAEFNKLSERPEVGHRRSDLTERNILFHHASPYFILSRRGKQGLQVLRIVHEARDLRKFL